MDHLVEVEKLVPVLEQVEVPTRIIGAAWPDQLRDLARQIDAGRVYDRDVPGLAEALSEVLQALDSRPAWRRRRR